MKKYETKAELLDVGQEDYLDAKEASKILNCHPETVRRYARDKTIRAYRATKTSPWRFKRSDLDAHMQGQANKETS